MFLLYFLLWVIFNGKFTLEIAVFGVIIAGAVFAFSCKFMDYSLEKEKKLYRRVFLFLRYCGVLVSEIVKANLNVIHLILSEQESIEPVLVSFHSPLKTPEARAFLANAITLTPGTITVSLEDSEYLVHCLDESLAPGMDSSIFVDYLSRLEEIGTEEKEKDKVKVKEKAREKAKKKKK